MSHTKERASPGPEPVRADFVPVGDYTSREFLQLENERMWPRVWLMACRVEELAGPWTVYRVEFRAPERFDRVMPVSLTPSAAERVQSFLVKRGRGVGLRLGVKKTGCSGFAYVVSYADDVGAADIVFEDRGVKVIVDADSLRYVDGTEIDFVREGLSEAFKFRNPNVRGECGCGEA